MSLSIQQISSMFSTSCWTERVALQDSTTVSNTLGEGVTLKVFMILSRYSSLILLIRRDTHLMATVPPPRDCKPKSPASSHRFQLPPSQCPTPTQAALYLLRSTLVHLFPAFLYPKKLPGLMMVCRRALSSLSPQHSLGQILAACYTVGTLHLEPMLPIVCGGRQDHCCAHTDTCHSSGCPSLWVCSKGNCIVASETHFSSLGFLLWRHVGFCQMSFLHLLK